MKITQVTIYHVHKRPTTGQRPILVRVDTDEGIYGVGEVGLAYGVGGAAGAAMVKELAARIIGKDPFRTEAIWEDFFKHTFWGQGGGTVVFSGISAIDIALWDIKAKALGVPLYQLLGGKTREKVRAYASQTQFGWNHPGRLVLTSVEQYAEEARRAVEDGYDAIKVDVLAHNAEGQPTKEALTGRLSQQTLRLGIARVAAIREAVGPDVDIIIENHANTDTGAAIQFAQALEPYNIYFYEEVNTPLNPELTLAVKDKTGHRVADQTQQVAQRHGGGCTGALEEAAAGNDSRHNVISSLKGDFLFSFLFGYTVSGAQMQEPGAILYNNFTSGVTPAVKAP